ncbi:hypothetical protein ABGB12_34300 [Actinocorallia sp. B10E7]|uniref:hypothetical protein n=1 Tax=Actinocorallia sp. B10E7 TaxID=3153558 RepID=UPI00325E3B84
MLGCESGGRAWSALPGDAPLPAKAVPLLLAHGAALAEALPAPGVHDLWCTVTAEAILRSARLRVLSALAERVLDDPPSPFVLDITGMSRGDLAAWTAGCAARCAALTRLMGEAADREALRLLGESDPPLDTSVVDKAEGLVQGVAEAESLGRVGRRVKRGYTSLDPTVSARARVQVLEMAARALATRSPAAGLSGVDPLAAAVRTLNAAARRGIEQALPAAVHLQVFSAFPAHPTRDWLIHRLRGALDAVTDRGGAALDETLLDDAERWRSLLEEEAEQVFLAEVLERHFAGFGIPLSVTTDQVAPAVVLAGPDGRLLLDGGRVRGGPSGDGTVSSRFVEAFGLLGSVTGGIPVWDPAAFAEPRGTAGLDQSPNSLTRR